LWGEIQENQETPAILFHQVPNQRLAHGNRRPPEDIGTGTAAENR